MDSTDICDDAGNIKIEALQEYARQRIRELDEDLSRLKAERTRWASVIGEHWERGAVRQKRRARTGAPRAQALPHRKRQPAQEPVLSAINGRWHRATDVANTTGIPLKRVSQVLSRLHSLGVVKRRKPKGGKQYGYEYKRAA